MLLFFLFCQVPLLSFPLVAGFMVWWGLQGGGYQLFGVRFATQMFALLALPFIYIRTNTRLRINKWGVLPVLPGASGADPRAGQAGGLWLRRKRRQERAYRSSPPKNCAPGRDIPGRFSILNFHVPFYADFFSKDPL